jgi:hypothetical protein
MRLKKKAMPGGVKNYSRLARSVTLLLFVSYFIVNCTGYNPAMYPSYEVLAPKDEVTVNPVGFIIFDPTLGFYIVSWDVGFEPKVGTDYFVINYAFMIHYRELWDEVIKLRGLIK